MRRLRSLCRRMSRGGLGFYAVVAFRRPRRYRIYHSNFRDMRFSCFVHEADTIDECELFLLDQC